MPILGFSMNVRFKYVHVGLKIAQICEFVYKSNANWDFSSNSYNCDYF